MSRRIAQWSACSADPIGAERLLAALLDVGAHELFCVLLGHAAGRGGRCADVVGGLAVPLLDVVGGRLLDDVLLVVVLRRALLPAGVLRRHALAPCTRGARGPDSTLAPSHDDCPVIA